MKKKDEFAAWKKKKEEFVSAMCAPRRPAAPGYTWLGEIWGSTILIFGDIVHQLKSVLRKVKKNLRNHYCEMTKFDDKIIIRCLADNNYDLKKTLNIIMKNVINDKLPKSWDL